MIPEAIPILAEVLRTRLVARRLRSRADIEAHQRRLLRRHLDFVSANVPFYEDFRGLPLERWPIMDKASSLANFDDLNSVGVCAAEAWAAAEAGLASGNASGSLRGLTVGTSTGTSGNRGLFLVAPRERRLWLGSIVAKTLPDFPWRAHRVALMLSTGNELYETTNRSRRLSFAFFDLKRGVEASRGEMEAFAPDVLVAPPKALRMVADGGFRIRPSSIFSGGEVLDPLDGAAVEARFGTRVRPIYQATEGFLGVTCPHGTLHLNEDSVHFELEPIPGQPGRVSPIVTDLRRRAQAMVRYRMNDILVLADGCACGSPLRAVARVEGRSDDAFLLPGRDGGTVAVMPDAIRNAVLDADRRIDDFRAVQPGASHVSVSLPGEAAAAVEPVRRSLESLFEAWGCRIARLDVLVGIGHEADHVKLRRVRRDRMPEGT